MFRGTLVAQIIAVICAVFLAKLYGEEAYGLFGVFISITSIASIISTLQLDKCIIIAKNEKESINWFNFLMLLVLFIIAISSLFVLFSFGFIDYQQDEKNIFFLAIIGTLLLSINLLNVNFFTFKKEFAIISNSKIFLTISNVILQFVLFTKYHLFGLIIGFIISQLLLSFYYFYLHRKFISKPNIYQIKEGIKSNTSIIKFLLPSNITNSLANNLMPILILTVFGAKEAGVYFFSFKILGTPLFLISSSVSQVFFQKSSELLRTNVKELLNKTKKIVRINLLLMFVFLVFINTIGIYFLEFYFEKSWNNLKLYTLILSILIFARASFNPISSLIIVLDKNQIGLVFNIYLFIVNLGAVYIGYFYNNILYTISTLAILGGIGYIILLLYFLNHLKSISNNNVK